MRSTTLRTLLPAVLCALGVTQVACELPRECNDDKFCRDTYGAANFCAEDGICQQYTQSEYLAGQCNATEGDVFAPNAINVGSLLALNRQADYFGLIEPIANSVRLARSEINAISGLDGVEQFNGKEINLIFCNTNGENTLALEGAQHFADIGVQAVVGPDFSGYTVEVVPQAFVPGGVLAISPSATAPALSGLNDEGLFWRTVPSDEIQTKVLAQLIEDVAMNVAQPADGTSKIVVLVREQDAYADGLRQGILEFLPDTLTGADDFTIIEYPNAGAGTGTDYSQQVLEASEFEPDVVVVLGLTEVWDIFTQLDSVFDPDSMGDDTIYITADGGKDNAKATEARTDRPGLLDRIYGTAPRALNADEYTPYRTFSLRWRSEYKTDADSQPFITNGYDALYLLAFAMAGAGDYDGRAMAAAMKNLTTVGAAEIEANQQDFTSGVTALTNQQPIDFVGASGPIDFDDNGDPTSATISLWCFESAGDGTFIVDRGDLQSAGSTQYNALRCNPLPTNDEGM